MAATTSRSCSFGSPGKCDSVNLSGDRLTSRSLTATEVSVSNLTVPIVGLAAPAGVYATAAQATICRWPSQLAICGW